MFAFPVSDYEKIMNKANGFSLMSNAARLWSIVHIERIITRFCAIGNTILSENIARVPPPFHSVSRRTAAISSRRTLPRPPPAKPQRKAAHRR